MFADDGWIVGRNRFSFVIVCQLSRKRDRQAPDFGRAGRNVCDKRIVKADGLATRGGTRNHFLHRDTDLQMGESGGLGGQIDNGFAFRRTFLSQDRGYEEGGNVVDNQRGCAAIDVSR